MYDTWTLLRQVIDEQNEKKEKVQWVAKDCSKLIEQKMKDTDEGDREMRIGPRGLTSFVEVNVKQEEEENPPEDANIAESAGIVFSNMGQDRLLTKA